MTPSIKLVQKRLSTMAMALLFAMTASPCLAVSPSELWVPVPCNPASDEILELRRSAGHERPSSVWEDHDRALLRAQPGDSDYVPYLYPRTPEQQLEDLRYVVLNRLFPAQGDLSKKESDFRRHLAKEPLDFQLEISRVANWGHSRCTTSRPRMWSFWLRLFDPISGDEVANASLAASGHLQVFSLLRTSDTKAYQRRALPPLDEIQQQLPISLDPVLDAQLVAIDGLPAQCMPWIPCIAFRSGPDIYVWDGGEHLYRIRPDAPRETLTEHMNRERQKFQQEGLPALGPKMTDTPWVTVGQGWMQAERVPIPPG